MMSNNNYDYEKLIKEIRHRYELKYGNKIDDEIIYLIIRMNELEVSIKSEIKELKTFNQSAKPTIIRTLEKPKSKNNKTILFLLIVIILLQIISLILK